MQDNRDKRVELLQKYAYKFFPATKYMDYAVKVEAYTLGKAANLVLNVDGCIGALFLDLLNSSSQFTLVILSYQIVLTLIAESAVNRKPRGLGHQMNPHVQILNDQSQEQPLGNRKNLCRRLCQVYPRPASLRRQDQEEIAPWQQIELLSLIAQAEIKEIVKIGYLNGLFVLARSIGLIGHALDQKRLQQPLYRHPWDEVLYTK